MHGRLAAPQATDAGEPWPTAAIPVENPYYSCKPTRVRSQELANDRIAKATAARERAQMLAEIAAEQEEALPSASFKEAAAVGSGKQASFSVRRKCQAR